MNYKWFVFFKGNGIFLNTLCDHYHHLNFDPDFVYGGHNLFEYSQISPQVVQRYHPKFLANNPCKVEDVLKVLSKCEEAPFITVHEWNDFPFEEIRKYYDVYKAEKYEIDNLVKILNDSLTINGNRK